MQPPADDVHHRHRQQGLGVAGEVAPERLAGDGGLGARAGERDGEDGVGPEARLVRRAVELDEGPVDRGEVDAGAEDGRGDLRVHGLDRAEHAAPAEPLGIAVPALDRLVPAGGGAGGDACPRGRPVGEPELRLDGRPSA